MALVSQRRDGEIRKQAVRHYNYNAKKIRELEKEEANQVKKNKK